MHRDTLSILALLPIPLNPRFPHSSSLFFSFFFLPPPPPSFYCMECFILYFFASIFNSGSILFLYSIEKGIPLGSRSRYFTMMLAGRRICVQTTHTAMAVAPVVGRRNLNLHEHDSKMLMDRFGVTTQRWRLARSKAEALKASTDLVKETEAPELVVKAQILAGGRGKGHFKETQFKGGVHLCKTPQQAADLADEMLGKHLVTKQTGPDGSLVQKVMIAESVELKRELYFALLMDRAYNGP